MIRFLFVIVFAACATSAPHHVLDDAVADPTGVWDMTLTWTHGTCVLAGSFQSSLTVERGPGTGYVIDGHHGVFVSGTVVCQVSMCQMSFTEVGPGPDPDSYVTGISMAADLTVDRYGAIGGSGAVSYLFDDASTCSHRFVATGVLR